MNNVKKNLLGLMCSLLLTPLCMGENAAVQTWDKPAIAHDIKKFNNMCKFLANNNNNLESLQEDLQEIANNLNIFLQSNSIPQKRSLLQNIWFGLTKATHKTGQALHTTSSFVVRGVLLKTVCPKLKQAALIIWPFIYNKGQLLYENVAKKFNPNAIDGIIDTGAKRLGFFVLKILMGRQISNQEREEIVKWLQLFGLPENALQEIQQQESQQ